MKKIRRVRSTHRNRLDCHKLRWHSLPKVRETHPTFLGDDKLMLRFHSRSALIFTPPLGHTAATSFAFWPCPYDVLFDVLTTSDIKIKAHLHKPQMTLPSFLCAFVASLNFILSLWFNLFRSVTQ
jgi:hypothetical protein